MSVLTELDARIADAVHKVVAEVASSEPTIDAAVMRALRDLGAPAEVTDAVQALIRALVAHFTALAAKDTPEQLALPDGEEAVAGAAG
jgi:hypothetical protein